MRSHVVFTAAMLIALPACNLLIDTNDLERGPESRGNVLELTFNDGLTRDSSGWMHAVNSSHDPFPTETGYFGGGFEFAGTTGERDRLVLDDSDVLSLGNQLTIEMWLLRRDTSNSPATLYGDRNNDGQQEYWLRLNGGDVEFLTNDEGQLVEYRTTVLSIENDVWIHLAVTWDGTTLSFYRDGALRDEVQNFVHEPQPIDNSFYIGSTVGSASFHGTLDEIKVSNRAKSPDEIRASMMFDSAAAGL